MKQFTRFAAVTALVLVAALPSFAAETWTIDRAHSSVGFKVRHMMSSVSGIFRDFDAVINVDRENPKNDSVEFTIQTASIDTASEGRDKHLRSSDFFDAEKYPTISFKSTSIKEVTQGKYEVTGDFTMHGVTKRLTLPVTFLGSAKTQRGEVAGLEIETTINRKDFGVVWNRTLDEGAILLGDDVKVSINLEVRKKAPEAPKPAAQ
jgi:polyisoprenoid-binding protein YceI